MTLDSHYCNRLLTGCPDSSALSSLIHSIPQQKWPYSTNEVMSMLCIESCGSIQFSHSVMSCSLRPHGVQHARPPCPSPTPEVYSNSCPLSQSCHPAISSSVVPFSCPQSLPASESFQMSQFFPSGEHSIGVSASASVLPMNIQG